MKFFFPFFCIRCIYRVRTAIVFYNFIFIKNYLVFKGVNRNVLIGEIIYYFSITIKRVRFIIVIKINGLNFELLVNFFKCILWIIIQNKQCAFVMFKLLFYAF